MPLLLPTTLTSTRLIYIIVRSPVHFLRPSIYPLSRSPGKVPYLVHSNLSLREQAFLTLSRLSSFSAYRAKIVQSLINYTMSLDHNDSELAEELILRVPPSLSSSFSPSHPRS